VTQRRTLARPTLRIEGIGLHTGAPGWVRLLPADSAQHGIAFISESGVVIQALAGNVVDARRSTTLAAAGTRLSTVEHLMSALAGCGVTDATIEFGGPEVPILDGSSQPFVLAMDDAGLQDIESQVAPVVVRTPVEAAGPGGSRLVALPGDYFEAHAIIGYPERQCIQTHAASFLSVRDDYRRAVAPARTYGFLSELDALLASGLATGATIDNCIALADDGSADPRTPLRFENELARHKLLDVMGDLALVGRPIQACIIALRPSHAVNCDLARRLREL
jgi:UDP-3-O-[3-hydroxymyristoyl] N-acetylglucosamine deacetylase